MANKVTIQIDGDSKKYQSELTTIEKKNKKLSASSVLSAGLMTAAVYGITKAVISVTKAYAEQEQIENKVAQTIAATGSAAGVTAQEMYDLAASLQNVTKFGDEATLTATNILLTFKNISKDVLPQTVEAMLDVATTMGTDAKSSAVQLGKALNDPITGLTALSRVGITFTDQQKDQIKTLQKSGDILSAQKIILKELQSQFGGAARAAAAGSGVYAQLGNEVGDLAEKAGKASSGPLQSLAGRLLALGKRANAFLKIFQKDATVLDKFTEKAKNNASQIATLEANLAKYGGNKIYEKNTQSKIDALKKESLAINEVINDQKRLNKEGADNDALKKANAEALKEREDALRKQASIDSAFAEEKRQALLSNYSNERDDFLASEQAKIDARKELLASQQESGGIEKDEAELEARRIQISELELIEEEAGIKKLEREGKQAKALTKINQKITKDVEADLKKRTQAETAYANAKLDILTNTAALAVQVLGAENKAAFALTQAAALASAIVNTARAVTAVLPNYPLAVATGIAGGLQVATIAAQTIQGFEKGGVVGNGFMGATAGSDNRTITARDGEMFLNGPEQKRLFDIATGAESSIGSSQNITYTIVPDTKRLFKVMQTEAMSADAKGVGKFVMKR